MSSPSPFSTGNSQNSKILRIHVWISGQVQGVGYRLSTLSEARQRDLQGWVKNLPDGRVEAVFEGTPKNIEDIIKWCRHGPPTAIPETVEIEFEEVEGLQGFEIVGR
jgi:acylphosphatase